MIGRKGNLNYLKIVKYVKDNSMFQVIITKKKYVKSNLNLVQQIQIKTGLAG